MIASLNRLKTKLDTTKGPTVAKQDIHSLVLAVSPLNASLQSLASVNFLDVGTWEQSYLTAIDGVKTADALVRSDLHLHPAS